MKINKEVFNKLKQLDRIEFMQKYVFIREINKNSITAFVTLGFLLLTSSVINFYILYFITTGILLNFVILKITMLSWLTFLIIGISCDLALEIIKIKKMTELEEEYFKIEVKP